jgi:hypothetical protein
MPLRIRVVGARAFCALLDDGHTVRRVASRKTGDRMSPVRQPTECRRSCMPALHVGARAFCALLDDGHTVRRHASQLTGDSPPSGSRQNVGAPYASIRVAKSGTPHSLPEANIPEAPNQPRQIKTPDPASTLAYKSSLQKKSKNTSCFDPILMTPSNLSNVAARL